MALSECPECSRHVRIGAGACPFCDHALPAAFGRSRAGAVLVGAAAITAMTACSRLVATKYGGPPAPAPESEPADADQPPEHPATPEDEPAEAAEEAAVEPDPQ